MERYQGKYALVQFCPVPERLEFLNIGLVLLVPQLDFVGIRFARGQSRLDRVFGRQQKSYLDAIKEAFESRLRAELERNASGASLDEFARKRANDVRISQLLPVMVSDPHVELDDLFDQLVGEDGPAVREPRMKQKLQKVFAAHKVEQFLERPDELELPEYGMKISVPYGYQNGRYNLIDGMRLSGSVSEGLREAGKRALEGGLIWKHFSGHANGKQLVVVGDFDKQSNGFYHAVHDQFAASHVKLYRLDDMHALLNDIVDNAAEHGRIAGRP